MPNGVICGGAVDGSNQAGESVTCQAMVTWPDGGAAAAGKAVAARAAAAMSSGAVSRRRKPEIWNDVMTTTPSGDVGTWLVVKMAGDDAVADRALLRHLGRAARRGVRAARVEVAAARRVERARHLALQHHVLATLVGMARQGGREQCLGVGMQWL